MKKTLLCLLLVLTLVGCGGSLSKPEDMSDEDFGYIKEALNASDDFLNGEITIGDIEHKYDYVSTMLSGEDDASDYIAALLTVTLSQLENISSIDDAGENAAELVHECSDEIENALE